MLTDTPLDVQLAAQEGDRLRILVVGAGIAGITVSQLLRQAGLHPVLVDRMPAPTHPGYMLALMPTVDRAISDLGHRQSYLDASTPLSSYRFRSHHGLTLRTDPLGELLSPYGDYRGISRGALIEVLTTDGCPVTWDTTVAGVEPAADRRRVTFARGDGRSASVGEVDLVIAADGIRSDMRHTLDAPMSRPVDTGWSGWVFWAHGLGDPTLIEEVWGDGFFVGVYPVKDGYGVFVAGPNKDIAAGPGAFTAAIRTRLRVLDPRMAAALDAATTDPGAYVWRLDDERAARWVLPNGILLGDAAAGFLPTAGVGAGMAIESAWMLARMLMDSDRQSLGAVLAAWERVERPRVERAHESSRILARLMLRRGAPTAWLRETVMRMLSVKAAMRPFLAIIADQPDPDAIAAEVLAKAQ